MGMPGFVTSLILLLINIVLALRLEKRLNSNAELELIVLVVLLLVSFASLFGVYKNKRWGWPVMTVLFSLCGANYVWLFSSLQGSLTFWAGMLTNVFALLVGILGIETYVPEEPEELETYEENEKKSSRKKSNKRSKVVKVESFNDKKLI